MATPTATNPTPSIANVDGDAHFADRIVAVSGDAPRTIHDPGVRSALGAPTAHAGRDPTRLRARRGTVRISRRPPRFRREAPRCPCPLLARRATREASRPSRPFQTSTRRSRRRRPRRYPPSTRAPANAGVTHCISSFATRRDATGPTVPNRHVSVDPARFDSGGYACPTRDVVAPPRDGTRAGRSRAAKAATREESSRGTPRRRRRRKRRGWNRREARLESPEARLEKSDETTSVAPPSADFAAKTPHATRIVVATIPPPACLAAVGASRHARSRDETAMMSVARASASSPKTQRHPSETDLRGETVSDDENRRTAPRDALVHARRRARRRGNPSNRPIFVVAMFFTFAASSSAWRPSRIETCRVDVESNRRRRIREHVRDGRTPATATRWRVRARVPTAPARRTEPPRSRSTSPRGVRRFPRDTRARWPRVRTRDR